MRDVRGAGKSTDAAQETEDIANGDEVLSNPQAEWQGSGSDARPQTFLETTGLASAEILPYFKRTPKYVLSQFEK